MSKLSRRSIVASAATLPALACRRSLATATPTIGSSRSPPKFKKHMSSLARPAR
jgi:hypothetical protein